MSARDLDRIYWTLVIKGPMTLCELQAWTNWTRHRTNGALQRLKQSQCVRLIERHQHRGAVVQALGARMTCGKWVAITEVEIVDAEIRQMPKQRCAHGHAMTPANTYRYRDLNACRLCRASRDREYQSRRRAKRVAA